MAELTMMSTEQTQTLGDHIVSLCAERQIAIVPWPEDMREKSMVGFDIMRNETGLDIDSSLQSALQGRAAAGSGRMIGPSQVFSNYQPGQAEWPLESYAVMLHEIGHWERGRGEVEAWEWALENYAGVWTEGCQKVMEFGLMSYFLSQSSAFDQTNGATLLELGESMIGFDPMEAV